MDVTLQVNGHFHRLRLDPRTTLLDALREHVAMTGTKKGCDHGQCGACTVLLDGRRINSCLTLAVMHDGQAITTIEGLAAAETLHPMQAAFIEHDGFQCGYCTSGQICSAVGMLAESRAGMPSYVTEDLSVAHPALTDAEIRERMSGNICRCAAYPNIVAAIRQVAGSTRMKAFTYQRASSPAQAAAAAAQPDTRIIAGGTNLLDLMKLEVETPVHLVDINRLDLARIEDTQRWRAAHRRDGAQQRSCRRQPCSRTLRGAEPRPAGRCQRATAQQGHDRRQSDAAHAVLLFL